MWSCLHLIEGRLHADAEMTGYFTETRRSSGKLRAVELLRNILDGHVLVSTHELETVHIAHGPAQIEVGCGFHSARLLECRETFRGAKLVNEPDHLSPGHHPGPTATARDLVLSLPAAERVAAVLKELLNRITISCLPRREPANTVLGDVFLYELLLIADDEENRLCLLLGFAPLRPWCFSLDDSGPRFDRVSLRCVPVAAVYPLQADAEAVRSAKDRPSGSVEAFTDLRRGAALRGHLCEYRVLFGGPLRSRRPDHASTQTMQEIQKAASDRHITRQAHWLLVSG